MKSLRKPQKFLSDSDVAASAAAAAVAAEQLMQLSDEDNNSEKSSCNVVKKKGLENDEDYVQSKDEITWAKKIEEIFGKEEEIYPPKKRRYRSVASLYRSTNPIPMAFGMNHRKKMRY